MLLRPRTALVATALLTAFVLAPASGREEERDTPLSKPAAVKRDKAPAPPKKEDPRVKAWKDSVRRGAAWLAANQNRDGSWGGHPHANVAVTSISLLALMANGNTESRGIHSRQVRDGVKNLLRHVTTRAGQTSRRPAGYIYVKGDEYSRMHGQGYATQVLALAYGMGEKKRRKEMKEKLTLAVRCIEKAQDDSGGWYYKPTPNGHEGSITVCQIQALRAAREAGIQVSAGVIEKAVTYMERSWDEETGGFCYALDDRDRHSYALTAAALTTLFGLGEYDRREMIQAGLKYMKRQFRRNWTGKAEWFFYGNLYASQAIHQVGKTSWGQPYWEEWWPRMRDYLVKLQQPGGAWPRTTYRSSEDFGPAYRTACVLMMLQVPLELLPTFQR
jgi:hypothetical protein